MRKVVVVSGGSKGLGQEIVKALLRHEAYQVATFSRSTSAFVETMQADSAFSERFLFQEVDLTNKAAVKSFIQQVKERFGAVDILINNAGIANDALLALQTDQEIDQMIEVNLKGTIGLTRLAVREMLPQRHGRIINITSIVGSRGYRGLAVYALTKAGLDGFTRSLARELGSRGITVNSVAPGFIETEMTHGLSEKQRQQIVKRTPLNRLGRPEDIVPFILFLCSDGADFMTGQTIVIDGGVTA